MSKSDKIIIFLFYLPFIVGMMFLTPGIYENEVQAEKERLQELSDHWDECNALNGTKQESCYDFYEIDYKGETDKEYYLANPPSGLRIPVGGSVIILWVIFGFIYSIIGWLAILGILDIVEGTKQQIAYYRKGKSLEEEIRYWDEEDDPW